MEKTLARTLYELANQILKQLKQSRDKKEMIPVKYPYFQTKISGFEYEKGSGGYTTSFEPFFKENWDDRKRFDFANKVKQFEEYKEMVITIAENYNVSEAQSDFWLDKFVHRIMDESLQKIDEKNIVELVSLFISDLERTPIQWNPVVWLDGIYMETDVIEINKNLRIKKPEPSDLEYEIRYDNTPAIRSDLEFNMPSAIMQISRRAKGQQEINCMIETIISIFRLFKVGSILVQKIQWNPVSILELSGISWSHKYSAHFKYELNKDNEQELCSFFKIMEPIIFNYTVRKKNKEKNFITIAFDRYNNALEESTPESRLTYGTMCLEALYLGGETEMTRRLSQRVACALSLLDYKPLDVSSVIMRAYRIRSRFVHGAIIEDNERKNITKLEKELLEYARTSLIIFIQFQDKIKKDNFLTKLDNSLLDEKEKKKLKEFIISNCPREN